MVESQNNSMEAFDGLTREQLGNLVKYATGKIRIKQKHLTPIGISDDVLALMKDGEWDRKQEYISLFALILRRVVPQKMKLKYFPSRERTEKKMRGENGNLNEYKDFLLELFRMPNLPPKAPKRRINYYEGLRRRTYDDSNSLRDRQSGAWDSSTACKIGYHSDFEYGITDT